MEILKLLATSLQRRDQVPNKATAALILAENNPENITQLLSIIESAPNQHLLFDALKVCEIVAEAKPEMVSNAFDFLIPCIESSTNKVRWMAMSALSHICQFHLAKTYNLLPKILLIMDSGGVIQRDKGVVILITLYEQYPKAINSLLLDQILACPPNQVGQYTEKWMPIISDSDRVKLISALEQRLDEFDNPSHKRRAAKNLKKLNKIALK